MHFVLDPFAGELGHRSAVHVYGRRVSGRDSTRVPCERFNLN